MRILERWNDHWFGPAPYFDLAVVRIVLVGLQVFMLLGATYGMLHYTVNLPGEMYNPIVAMKTLLWPLGWGVQPPEALVFAVYWTTLIAGLLALLGILTAVTLKVFAVGSIFCQAYIYSFGNFHHPEAVMMVALLALSFSPAGRELSVDRWIRIRFAGKASAAPAPIDSTGPFAAWPLRLMQWFVPLMYLSALSSKLTIGGLEWANGFTLQYYLIEDGLRGSSELALWAAQHHVAILLAQWGVLFFQATFFLILFFPRLKWFYLPAGICMHLGIYLTLNAPFPQWIAIYAVYIPWAELVRRLHAPPMTRQRPGWQT